MNSAASVLRANSVILKKLVICAALMFCFGYAMVPIYEKFCKVTGIRNLLQPDDVAPINSQIDKSRLVTIEFDANTLKLPWKFKPEVSHLQVHPGEMTQVVYEITNEQGRKMVGQAVPSYSPRRSAEFLKNSIVFALKKRCWQQEKHANCQWCLWSIHNYQKI